MAQAQPHRNIEGEEEEEQHEKISLHDVELKVSIKSKSCETVSSSSSTSSPFKFNVQAPEFVPRSHTPAPAAQTQMPISGYFYPCFHYLGPTAGSDWFFLGEQDPHAYLISNPNLALPNSSNKTTLLTDDLRQKIVKQVPFPFLCWVLNVLFNRTIDISMSGLWIFCCLLSLFPFRIKNFSKNLIFFLKQFSYWNEKNSIPFQSQ